jgi:hypothetical protein
MLRVAAGRLRAFLRRGREREALVQALKAALAAVLALLATQALAGGNGAAQAFLGPYVAVLTVTMTVRRSWAGAARQALLVVLGVLLAFGAGHLWPAVALAVVVVVGLLVGRWRRLGPDGHWLAVTAVILLVNGSAARPDDLAAWVLFTLVGAVLGAAVNTFVLPPVHLQDAGDAVRSLAEEISGQLRAVAGGVGDGWGQGDAATWVEQARGLRSAVRRAHSAVWVGRESVRWNPRRRAIGRADSLLAGPAVVERLEHLAERVVQVASCSAIWPTSVTSPPTRPSPSCSDDSPQPSTPGATPRAPSTTSWPGRRRRSTSCAPTPRPSLRTSAAPAW